ncbi:cytochrome P450 [Kribbella sp. DT2]|uniref:cytochrome P450 n=1 Tax=Kribbella sp. DT2 TaxID=3393427 RepID=UPI003CF97217
MDPFAPRTRGITEPDPIRLDLRRRGPVVEAPAPPGGPVWIVTEETLARQVLTDPRIVKDPAYAPPEWDVRRAGLEATAAEQPSLTTYDGPAHTALRKAHTPLLTAKRIQQQRSRVRELATEQLQALATASTTAVGVPATAEPPAALGAMPPTPGAVPPAAVDLMADFATRFPLTVVCDLLGVPAHETDRAMVACRQMLTGDQGEAIATLRAVAATASRDALAGELYEQVPDGITDEDVHYLLFALIFAGQLTTDASVGFVLANGLNEPGSSGSDLVDRVLRQHPPAPFTLWRFTTTPLELAGVQLPANAPVLVDIEGINTRPGRPEGPDLSFGAGAHYCIGAQLAHLELTVVLDVLRTNHPNARLAIPFEQLRQFTPGGNTGNRLASLPILF